MRQKDGFLAWECLLFFSTFSLRYSHPLLQVPDKIMAFSMKFAHTILSHRGWRSLWNWSISTSTFAQLTQSWWDSGLWSWERWIRLSMCGSMVRSASLYVLRVPARGVLMWLVFVALTISNQASEKKKKKMLPYWLMGKKKKNNCRTILTCWDERITAVPTGWSLCLAGGWDEL